MNKDELRGFIKGIVEYYNILDQIKIEKHLVFSIYELEKHWLIELSYFSVDIPSSNLDPTDDNSIEKIETIKLKPSKDITRRDLTMIITDALDEINASDLITERSEL